MDKQEAKKILKEFHDTSALFSVRTALETVFPELKEDEDEKIRKELITHCRNTRCVTEEGAERIAKWIAWLEKQGEQNPVEFKRSADDKNKLLIIEQILDCANLLISSQELTEIKNWLKALKQRIGG